jgi:hypothetical protein
MGLLNFFSSAKQYTVSIGSVSKRFGFSRAYLINLLASSGYNMNDMLFGTLNRDQLEIILGAYTNSVKTLYKNHSKNFQSYDKLKQESLKNFFQQFIRRSLFSSAVTIHINGEAVLSNRFLNEELDVELIRKYFYSIIQEIEFEELYGTDYIEWSSSISECVNASSPKYDWIHRELKWKIIINHSFNNIKSRIFSTIVTGHYYIFSSEEDYFTAFLTSFKRCFSAVIFTLGEVLKNNHSNFDPLWKPKLKYS